MAAAAHSLNRANYGRTVLVQRWRPELSAVRCGCAQLVINCERNTFGCVHWLMDGLPDSIHLCVCGLAQRYGW